MITLVQMSKLMSSAFAKSISLFASDSNGFTDADGEIE